MTILRRLKKKLLKRYAAYAFFPSWRVQLLRWCGFRIGRDVYIADGILVVEELTERENVHIGDRVSIAPRVTLVTSSHPNRSRIRSFAPVTSGPVVIEDDAWIGTGAVILPGVRIGRGAIVGALSVVTTDVSPFHIVAGQPARTVRVMNPDGLNE